MLQDDTTRCTKCVAGLAKRLQTASELQLICTSSVFSGYSHIWKNAHWYNDIATLRPFPETTRPTAKQLEGAKRIQSSLTHYFLDVTHYDYHDGSVVRSNSKDGHNISSGSHTKVLQRHQRSSASDIVVTALHDVVARLLDATSSMTEAPLQAVIETKQLLGFFSASHVCLLRSPRALRQLLWTKKLHFSSLFGHSSEADPSVNLLLDDLPALTDTKSNFPGCVKWRHLLEQGGLSERSRRILDRVREFLIFQGQEEVIPFLRLLLSNVTNENSLKAYKPHKQVLAVKHSLSSDAACNERSNSEDAYDSAIDASCTKRILANFCFRGSSLSVPTLEWNALINPGQWCLRFKGLFTAVAQAEILQGALQLAGSANVQMRTVISESSVEAWAPLSYATSHTAALHLGLPVELSERCPSVVAWIERHIPQTEFIFNHWSVNALPSSVSESGSTALVVALPPQTAHSATDNLDMNDKPNKNIKKRVGPAPSLANLMKRRRAERNPTLLSSHLTVKTASCLKTPGPRIDKESCNSPLDRLWECIPSRFRRALFTIKGKVVCYVGTFPFSPLTVSIPLSELPYLHHSVFFGIDYIVVSSTTSRKELSTFCQTGAKEKLRTPLWFLQAMYQATRHLTVSSHGDVCNDKALCSIAASLPSSSPLFHQIIPAYLLSNDQAEYSSRNVFFWVPAIVLADLVAPLTRDPLRHVLLRVSTPSLRTRLWQMAEKQAQWEAAVVDQLHKTSDEQRHVVFHDVLKRRPAFVVHLLCIFAFYTSSSASIPLEWRAVIAEQHREVRQLQLEFPYHHPRDAIKEKAGFEYVTPEPQLQSDSSVSSRLVAWYLPLNFLEDLYTMSHVSSFYTSLHKNRLRFSSLEEAGCVFPTSPSTPCNAVCILPA